MDTKLPSMVDVEVVVGLQCQLLQDTFI